MCGTHTRSSVTNCSPRAQNSLKPYTNDYYHVGVRWTWHNLPAGTAQPAEAPNHVVNLEVRDVPAFHAEDYMPPENESKSRVDFIYSDDFAETDPDKYWKKLGRKRNEQLESFIGKHKVMEQAAAEIITAGDSSETKLQKIYARVQQLRATPRTKPKKANRNKSATRRRTLETSKPCGRSNTAAPEN